MLWITGLSAQWITWLTPLWITGLSALWITRAGLAVDFPALRARAHISGPVGPVDYAPDGAVDYGPVGPVDYASL